MRLSIFLILLLSLNLTFIVPELAKKKPKSLASKKKPKSQYKPISDSEIEKYMNNRMLACVILTSWKVEKNYSSDYNEELTLNPSFTKTVCELLTTCYDKMDNAKALKFLKGKGVDYEGGKFAKYVNYDSKKFNKKSREELELTRREHIVLMAYLKHISEALKD